MDCSSQPHERLEFANRIGLEIDIHQVAVVITVLRLQNASNLVLYSLLVKNSEFDFICAFAQRAREVSVAKHH